VSKRGLRDPSISLEKGRPRRWKRKRKKGRESGGFEKQLVVAQKEKTLEIKKGSGYWRKTNVDLWKKGTTQKREERRERLVREEGRSPRRLKEKPKGLSWLLERPRKPPYRKKGHQDGREEGAEGMTESLQII